MTLAGAFRAWVSKKMGDGTGEYAGLLTLNPLAHLDFMGILFLFLFYFGWGRYVPINPFNIQAPHRRLKLLCAYLSDSVAYFVSSNCGITGTRNNCWSAHVIDSATYAYLCPKYVAFILINALSNVIFTHYHPFLYSDSL